jgi:outer membrane immunogenic protein
MRWSILAIAATALMGAAAPAGAADLGTAEALPTPDVVAAAPANNWTGFYLGALLGYSWGKSDTKPGFGQVTTDGVNGGAYAGANWQLGHVVLGAEADLLASGLSGSKDGLDVDQGLNGSLRARAGIALDQFLLYGTGGLAATDLQLKAGGKSDDQTLLGWTIGAGAEAMLAKNITARVEYRYSDYEDKTFTLGGGPVHGDLTTNTVRAGVGVKF